jgi:hypothetical protein
MMFLKNTGRRSSKALPGASDPLRFLPTIAAFPIWGCNFAIHQLAFNRMLWGLGELELGQVSILLLPAVSRLAFP